MSDSIDSYHENGFPRSVTKMASSLSLIIIIPSASPLGLICSLASLIIDFFSSPMTSDISPTLSHVSPRVLHNAAMRRGQESRSESTTGLIRQQNLRITIVANEICASLWSNSAFGIPASKGVQ